MPKRSTANSATIPPPVNGWNTRDPISGMDPLYAVEANNFVGKNGGVEVRQGSRYYSKGMTDLVAAAAPISSLSSLPTSNSQELLLALCGSLPLPGQIVWSLPYNASTANVNATSIYAPGDFTFSHIRPIVFKNTLVYGGYDSATMSTVIKTWSGGPAEADTAVPDQNIYTLCSYKKRLYFATKNPSANVNLLYYGDVDSLGVIPAANVYSVESLISSGAKIVSIGTITRSGAYTEDLLYVATFSGEILIFSGEYPASPTWSIVGKFKIPPVCGPNCFIAYGSDVLIFTTRGLVSLSSVMTSGQEISYLSESIASEFSSFQALLSVPYGMVFSSPAPIYFCGVWWPQEGLIILSYPTSTDEVPTTEQLVYHTTTNSWWKWTGLSIYSLAVANGDLYFGSSSGRVFKMTGDFDEDPANEGAVLTRTIKLRPAYNYFGDRSASKQFVEARPILKQSEGLTLTMDADVDYQDTTATNTVTDLANTAYKLYAPRVGLQGIGRCASIRIDGTVTTKRFRLEATEVIWNDGDI